MLKIASVACVMLLALAGCSSDSTLTPEEVESGLATYAAEINGDGVRFDDFSRLTSATALNQTITIRGESLLDMADIGDSYHSSRVDQAANVLCNDDTLRDLLRGRATMHFNWFSNDGESIGEMISVRGDEVCSDF